MALSTTIGVDIGGTNIKAGIVGPEGELLGRRSIETQAEHGFDHVLGRIVNLIRELVAEATALHAPTSAIGIGVPGPMSHAQGIIHSAPNMPGWVNVPLRQLIVDAVQLPTTVENDANSAAFGEFSAGAGRNTQDMVMLTLGTGIGGGVVLGGRLWRGHFDNAGEIGHMIVVPGGRPCPCGQRGCLERYASASSVGQRYDEARRVRGCVSDGAGVRETEAAEVSQLAIAGDASARAVWDETCYFLALAVVNIQHLFNPECVLLAGGLINAGAQLLSPVRRHFAALAWEAAPDFPRIEFATLGENAGLIGAAALAHREFE
jgi:glucokinase